VSQGKASNDQNGEISFNVYDEAGKQVGQNTYVFGFNAQTGQIATGELKRYSDDGRPILIALEYTPGKGEKSPIFKARVFDSKQDMEDAQGLLEGGVQMILVSRACAFTVHEVQKAGDGYVARLDGNGDPVAWIHAEYAKGDPGVERSGAVSASIQDKRFVVDIQPAAGELGLKGIDGNPITGIAHITVNNSLDSILGKDMSEPVQVSTELPDHKYVIMAYNSGMKKVLPFYGKSTLDVYKQFYTSPEHKEGFELLNLLKIGNIIYADDNASWLGGFEPQRGGSRRAKITMFNDNRGNEYPVKIGRDAKTGNDLHAYGVLEIDIRDDNFNPVQSLAYYLDKKGFPIDRLPHEQADNLRNVNITLSGKDENAMLLINDIAHGQNAYDKFEAFLPVAADVYEYVSDGVARPIGINIDDRGRNRIYFEFTSQATQTADGEWSVPAWVFYDMYDDQNVYLGQYAFESVVKWIEGEGGVKTYTYEIGNVLSWGAEVLSGPYTGNKFVYILDSTRIKDDGNYIISDEMLRKLNITERGSHILTVRDLDVLGIDKNNEAVDRILRAAQIHQAGLEAGDPSRVMLFDSSYPGREKEAVAMSQYPDSDEFEMVMYGPQGKEGVRFTFKDTASYDTNKFGLYIKIVENFQTDQGEQNKQTALNEGIVTIPVKLGNYYIGCRYNEETSSFEHGMFKTLDELTEAGYGIYEEITAAQIFRLDEAGPAKIEFFGDDGLSLGRTVTDTHQKINLLVFNEGGEKIGENVYEFIFDKLTGNAVVGRFLYFIDTKKAAEMADKMLEALRKDPAALEVFNLLTGAGLSSRGALNGKQLDALYSLIYTKDENGNLILTDNANDPAPAIQGIITFYNNVASYVAGISNNPNAMALVNKAFGLGLT
ncbi:MAG: hypothetical protein WC300_06410, partial [Candidatus Omnitrophota bacterium]